VHPFKLFDVHIGQTLEQCHAASQALCVYGKSKSATKCAAFAQFAALIQRNNDFGDGEHKKGPNIAGPFQSYL
jgi:hypothetical protein